MSSESRCRVASTLSRESDRELCETAHFSGFDDEPTPNAAAEVVDADECDRSDSNLELEGREAAAEKENALEMGHICTLTAIYRSASTTTTTPSL